MLDGEYTSFCLPSNTIKYKYWYNMTQMYVLKKLSPCCRELFVSCEECCNVSVGVGL